MVDALRNQFIKPTKELMATIFIAQSKWRMGSWYQGRGKSDMS